MIWGPESAQNRPPPDFYCLFFPIYCRKIENRAKIFTNSLFEYLFGQFSTKRGARKGGLEQTGLRCLWSPARHEEARRVLGVLPSLFFPPLHILFLFLYYIIFCCALFIAWSRLLAVPLYQQKRVAIFQSTRCSLSGLREYHYICLELVPTL